MRMRMEHQHCVYVCYPPEAPLGRLTIARAQQLWNEWEIQCLVLVSFSLQAFLLFFAGFRKRYRSRALSMLLWLAYLSADTVAVFVLGRLTRVTGDDPLVLFWAPFMLLHLGGQETITAFSMEDCALWKRHLLNLTTQVTLAIYVVGKQWRGDKQLVAPMVLLFISGTAKYVERIWRLGNAGSWAPGSTAWVPSVDPTMVHIKNEHYYENLLSSLVSEKKIELDHMEVNQFWSILAFFFNNVPKSYMTNHIIWRQDEREDVVRGISNGGAMLVYKVAEINLSLIYDFLYTKFGRLVGVLHRLAILALTSTALVLFVVHHKGKGPSAAVVKYYSVADVAISYILLVGAVGLEISSIFMWLMTSYWPFMGSTSGGRSPRIVLSMLKHLRTGIESNTLEWSGNLQQYNLMDEIIRNKETGQYGWLKRMMMWLMGDTTTKHVVVSPEVKKVFLDKLCEIASSRDNKERLGFTSFRAEELATHHKLQPSSSSSSSSSSSGRGAAQQAVSDICRGMDLVSSVLLWHVVTDICLVYDETPSKFRTCCQHLSNYIMHLIYQCNLMVDTDGEVKIRQFRYTMMEFIYRPTKRNFVEMARDASSVDVGRFGISTITDGVARVSSELLKNELAAADWEMIAGVWVKMLCYIARNCDHGFHAKQLSAGGEFLTQAKMVVFLLLEML